MCPKKSSVIGLLRWETLHSSSLDVSSVFSSSPQRQAKYSENKLKCTKARNDYLLNLAATNALVAKYYIHDISDLIDVSSILFLDVRVRGKTHLHIFTRTTEYEVTDFKRKLIDGG